MNKRNDRTETTDSGMANTSHADVSPSQPASPPETSDASTARAGSGYEDARIGYRAKSGDYRAIADRDLPSEYFLG